MGAQSWGPEEGALDCFESKSVSIQKLMHLNPGLHIPPGGPILQKEKAPPCELQV